MRRASSRALLQVAICLSTGGAVAGLRDLRKQGLVPHIGLGMNSNKDPLPPRSQRHIRRMPSTRPRIAPPPLPWLPKTTRSHPDTIPKQWPTEPIPDLAVLHGAWAVKPLDKWRRVRRPSPLRALCLFLCFRGACRLSRPTMQRWPKRIDGQHKLAPMFFACAFIQGGSLGQGRAGISRI